MTDPETVFRRAEFVPAEPAPGGDGVLRLQNPHWLYRPHRPIPDAVTIEFSPQVLSIDDEGRYQHSDFERDLLHQAGLTPIDPTVDKFRPARSFIVWDFSDKGGAVLGWEINDRRDLPVPGYGIRWIPDQPDSAERMWAIMADMVEAGAAPLSMLVNPPRPDVTSDAEAEIIRARYARPGLTVRTGTGDVAAQEPSAELIVIAPGGQIFALAPVEKPGATARLHVGTGQIVWGSAEDDLVLNLWEKLWTLRALL